MTYNDCKVEQLEDVITIDGSYLEGGGQILRNSIALSAILKKPVNIVKIRGGRNPPGLRPQHLHGINLIQQIYGGKLVGNHIKSIEVKYYPDNTKNFNILLCKCNNRIKIPQNYEIWWKLCINNFLKNRENHTFIVDTKTAGSVSLILQLALPALLYYPYKSKLILKGGTNVAFSPQIDYKIK